MDNVVQKLNVFIRQLFNDWPFETNFSMKNYKRTTFYKFKFKKKMAKHFIEFFQKRKHEKRILNRIFQQWTQLIQQLQ